MVPEKSNPAIATINRTRDLRSQTLFGPQRSNKHKTGLQKTGWSWNEEESVVTHRSNPKDRMAWW